MKKRILYIVGPNPTWYTQLRMWFLAAYGEFLTITFKGSKVNLKLEEQIRQIDEAFYTKNFPDGKVYFEISPDALHTEEMKNSILINLPPIILRVTQDFVNATDFREWTNIKNTFRDWDVIYLNSIPEARPISKRLQELFAYENKKLMIAVFYGQCSLN